MMSYFYANLTTKSHDISSQIKPKKSTINLKTHLNAQISIFTIYLTTYNQAQNNLILSHIRRFSSHNPM